METTHMFTISIADETADSLFRDILIQDYRGLVSNIADLEHMAELAPYQQEDLDDNIRIKAAMEILFGYYLTEDQAREVMEP
jgi:hypothetical protein